MQGKERFKEKSAEENVSHSKTVPGADGSSVIDRAQILKMSDHELAVLVAPLLVEDGITSKYWLETRWEYLRSVIGLLKVRVERMDDFVSMGRYFFFFDRNYDSALVSSIFTAVAADSLEILAKRFAELTPFTRETTGQVMSKLAGEMTVEYTQLAGTTRLAVTGTSVGPELSDVLVVMSQPVVVERLKKAVDYIRAKHKL